LLGLAAVIGWYYKKERICALLLAAFVASETILYWFRLYERTKACD
jgi:hypothetical protein